MHPNRLALALPLVLIAASTAASAQVPPIKPGLWQVRSERSVDGKPAPDMSKQVAKMQWIGADCGDVKPLLPGTQR